MSHRKPRMRTKEKRLVIAVFALFLIIFVAAFLFSAYLNPPVSRSSQPRAAIVDQLSLEGFQNKTFVETATDMLKQAGFQVDYYAGENVTVGLYRNVLSYGYKLIILRAHCGISAQAKEIAFFTSQSYGQPNPLTEPTLYGDVLYDRVGTATIHDPPAPGETTYFAIRSGFVKEYGSFDNATIIMMGCYGMNYTNTMAAAFIQKGAKVYIGWDGLENADHSDEATTALLKHLVLENQTVGQAVYNTVDEVKEDPVYKSKLGFYPPGSGDQTVQAAEARTQDNSIEQVDRVLLTLRVLSLEQPC